MIGVLDIGGTKLLAGVADDWGSVTIEALGRRRTPDDAPLATLVEMLDEVRDESQLTAIAIAVPGPFDRARGALVDPPGLAPAWHGLELRMGLGQHFGCPVGVENDANCAALAEATHGAGVGHDTVVYMTVSTGIGCGVVELGRLLVGRHDTEAGHQVLWPEWFGGPSCHCGGHGCLEALASGLAIERRFGIRAEELDDQAAWDDVGRWLGLGIVNLTALHDPDTVVLGGGVCASADRFWPSMVSTVEGSLFLQPVPPLLRAALGVERNMIGALALPELARLPR